MSPEDPENPNPEANKGGIWINGSNGSAIKYELGMTYEGEDAFIKATVNALTDLCIGSSTAAELIANLVGSEFTYNIVETDGKNAYAPDSHPSITVNNGKVEGYYGASGGTIKWNKSGGPFGVPEQRHKESINLSREGKIPAISLIHELAHAEDNRQGILMPSAVEKDGLSVSEWRATDVENSVRAEMKLSLRTHYKIEGDTKTPMGVSLLKQDVKGNISSVYSNKHFYPKKIR